MSFSIFSKQATSFSQPVRSRAAVAWATLFGIVSLASGVAAHAADAKPWPSQPISLIMGFPAGSGVDVVGRLIQEPLAKALGQPVVIDYRSGAAGNIASDYVARARPDGYTLAFGTAATHGSNAALYKNLSFDVEKDFVPVATVINVSNVLTINPDVIDVDSIEAFVKEVRANPGKYNYASTGNGAGTHMAFAEFNSRLGLDMVHVPYKGGPEAITAVLRGETCCIMNQVQTVLPHYASGKVRLLGVTTAERVQAIKDVPTIAESGLPETKGFDSAIWFGIFAPKGTDPAIVSTLNRAVSDVLKSPEVSKRFEAMGNTVRIESPQAFRATVAADRKKWADVAQRANIKLE